jgi:hypothetical protein
MISHEAGGQIEYPPWLSVYRGPTCANKSNAMFTKIKESITFLFTGYLQKYPQFVQYFLNVRLSSIFYTSKKSYRHRGVAEAATGGCSEGGRNRKSLYPRSRPRSASEV